MKVVALSSIKGGVGKTTSAVTLAHFASESGLRVLVWDVDPQGAATFALGVGRRVAGGGRRLFDSSRRLRDNVFESRWERLDVVPADFSLRRLDTAFTRIPKPRRTFGRLLDEVTDDYDVVVIDCPPGIGLSIESVLRATDLVMVPVVPATLPLRCFDQLSAFMAGDKRLRRVPAVAFLTMVDRRKRGHMDLVESLPSQRSELFTTMIPAAADVERLPDRREPLSLFAPTSPATTAYRELWGETAARLGI